MMIGRFHRRSLQGNWEDLGRRVRRRRYSEKRLLEKVPVYIPAFTDSEVGLDMGTWAMAREVDRVRSQAGHKGDLAILQTILQSYPSFNPYLDLNSYADHILSAKRLGIFTIGGGVLRNWRNRSARTSKSVICG